MISTTAIFLAFMPRICRERFVVMPNSATSRASVEDSSTTSTTKGGHFGIYYIVQKHSNLAKMVTFFHAPFMFQHCTRWELGVYKLKPDSVVWHTAAFPNRFFVKFIRGVTLCSHVTFMHQQQIEQNQNYYGNSLPPRGSGATGPVRAQAGHLVYLDTVTRL